MTHSITVDAHLSKEEKYASLIPKIKSLIESESDEIANLANVVSALYFGMGFFWVGFYIVRGEQLVLGPFHGPVACTRIAFNKGVCGTAWARKETVIVPDVDKFPGHIACSSDSKSEIVIPVIRNGQVVMVLDADSAELNSFDQTDQKHLEALCHYIAQK